MSVAEQSTQSPTLEELSLEEAIDELANVRTYKARLAADVAEANRAERELETMVGLLMEARGARKFERPGIRVGYVMVKRGSASVEYPSQLRTLLSKMEDVPKAALDAALPVVTPEPIVKPDLRKVRKLADYGTAVAKLVAAHIVEPLSFEQLVIETVPINVTPANDAITGCD